MCSYLFLACLQARNAYLSNKYRIVLRLVVFISYISIWIQINTIKFVFTNILVIIFQLFYKKFYMTDKERIEYILGILHLNAKQFSEAIGMKRVDTVYNILHGKHGISKSLAQMIVCKYRMISLDWLLLGIGNPILSYNSPSDRIKGIMFKNKLEPIGLASRIGLSFSAEILDIFHKDKEPSKEIVEAIIERFPDEKEFLLTGIDKQVKKEAEPFSSPWIINAPLVSYYAQAGYVKGWGDNEYVEQLPKVPFMVEGNHRGSYLCFEVKGDSMDDGTKQSYPDGCLVLGREVRKEHWSSKLHINDWDFIIVHREEGILIKRIITHDVNTGNLTLHSLNSMYDDFKVNMIDISQIFNVVKVITSVKR